MGLIEAIIAIVVPFVICKKEIRWKRSKKVVENIDDVTIRVNTKRGPVYVRGLRVKEIDALKFVEQYDEILKLYTRLINKVNLDVAIEIRTVKRAVDVTTIIKRLERELVHLRVQKMNDPTDVRTELKLRYLEKLLKLYTSNVTPSQLELNYILYSRSIEHLKAEEHALRNLLSSLLGGELENINVRDLRKVVNYNILSEKGTIVPTIALALATPPLEVPEIDGIYLGRNKETGYLEFLPIENLRHHVGIIGSTGMGKTTILSLFVARASVLLPYVELYVIDPKGDLEYLIRKMNLSVNLYRFKGSIESRRKELNDLMRNILNEIVNSEPGDGLKKLVIVDEAWLIDEDLIEEIAREGRSKGIGLILATQSPNDLGYEVWMNMGTWIILRLNRLDNDSWLCEALREYCESVKLLAKGEGLIKYTNSPPKIVEFDVDDILHFTKTTLKSSIPTSLRDSTMDSTDEVAGTSIRA